MMDFAINSLGIHGVAGKIDIDAAMVSIEQYQRPDGKYSLEIEMNGVESLAIPENAILDVTIKDNSVSFRREVTVGNWSSVNRRRVDIELDRALKPSRSQVFLNFVDPTTAVLYAATEELRLPVDDADGKRKAGESASFINFDVDPNQELPVKAVIEPTGPVIKFGRMGPSSVLESRSDFAFIGYALPGAIEKLVTALLIDEHNVLCTEEWEMMKSRMADFAGFDDWNDLKSKATGQAEIVALAEQCAEAYMKHGKLKHLLKHLYETKKSETEVEA